MRNLLRFLLTLRLLLWASPVVIACILAACFLPQLFLWYVGEIASCGMARACESRVLGLSGAPVVDVSVGGLVVIVALAIAFRVAAWALFEILGQLASQRLARAMMDGLARTRVTWFDTRASGTLLSRFSHDYPDLKQMGVIRMGDSLNAIFEVLCLASLVLLVDPRPFFAVLPLLALFLWLVARLGARMEKAKARVSLAMGTYLHRGTDLIDGAWTFFVYGKSAAMRARLRAATEELLAGTVAQASLVAGGRFLSDAVGNAYGFLFLVFTAWALAEGHVAQSVAAVLLTAVFRFQPAFSWLQWSTANLKESEASARRVFELVDLPAEEDEEFAPTAPRPARSSAALPREGDVTFHAYAASYRVDTPRVLDGVDVHFAAGARTGVVGRTGAGKSSLFQALMRMLYVHGGDVRIGGRSIFEASPEEVRALFCVVPQQPYLMAGRVRDALDLTGRASAPALQGALDTAGLALRLDDTLLEGGANLSVGERQLLCLARALATDQRILLMDEPTSSVDVETDARVQALLASTFRGRTVITIAHRLETLSAYDAVVDLGAVVDAGGAGGAGGAGNASRRPP